MGSTKSDEATEAMEYDFLSDVDAAEECFLSDLNVPYYYNLKKTLTAKSNILINGFVHPTAERFSIDFCKHTYDKANQKTTDIAFHFNPRFGENCVVRNSHINGVWGIEERHASRKNPFKRGQVYIMEIYIIKSEYLVSVNGSHFCSFAHRIDPGSVHAINISGDVKLLKVELSTREMYPSTEKTLFLMDDPQNTRVTPFVYHLPPNGLSLDSKIEITGRIKLLPYEFFIRLQSGSEVYPHPLVSYQLSAKWRPEENKVTINSLRRRKHGGDAGPEIVCPKVFKPNRYFIIIIHIKKFGYLTEVYAHKFPLLEHSAELSTVNTICVQGDIIIKDIKVLNSNKIT